MSGKWGQDQASDDPWLTPLIGRRTGEEVSFESGNFAGAPWRVQGVLPGLVGAHESVLAWGARQGSAGGGVDRFEFTDSNLLQTLEANVPAAPDSQDAQRPQLVPLAVLAFRLEQTAMRAIESLDRPCSFRDQSGEAEADNHFLDAGSTSFPSLFLDPMTIIVAERYGFAETLLKAAGRLLIARESIATLVHWWSLDRQKRRSPGSFGRDREGRMQYFEYNAHYRTSERDFWRGLRNRLNDSRVVVVDKFDDAHGRAFANLQNVMDRGTVATLACQRTMGKGACIVSVDAIFVDVLRKQLAAPAASLISMLHHAARHGTISLRQNAIAKAQLAYAGWQVVPVHARDFLALIREEKDQQVRDACVGALTSVLKDVNLPWGLRVVIETLNALGRTDLAIFGKRIDRLMFEALFDLPRSQRAQYLKPFPMARRSWYAETLRAWKNRTR